MISFEAINRKQLNKLLHTQIATKEASNNVRRTNSKQQTFTFFL